MTTLRIVRLAAASWWVGVTFAELAAFTKVAERAGISGGAIVTTNRTQTMRKIRVEEPAETASAGRIGDAPPEPPVTKAQAVEASAADSRQGMTFAELAAFTGAAERAGVSGDAVIEQATSGPDYTIRRLHVRRPAPPPPEPVVTSLQRVDAVAADRRRGMTFAELAAFAGQAARAGVAGDTIVKVIPAGRHLIRELSAEGAAPGQSAGRPGDPPSERPAEPPEQAGTTSHLVTVAAADRRRGMTFAELAAFAGQAARAGVGSDTIVKQVPARRHLIRELSAQRAVPAPHARQPGRG